MGCSLISQTSSGTRYSAQEKIQRLQYEKQNLSLQVCVSSFILFLRDFLHRVPVTDVLYVSVCWSVFSYFFWCILHTNNFVSLCSLTYFANRYLCLKILDIFPDSFLWCFFLSFFLSSSCLPGTVSVSFFVFVFVLQSMLWRCWSTHSVMSDWGRVTMAIFLTLRMKLKSKGCAVFP